MGLKEFLSQAGRIINQSEEREQGLKVSFVDRVSQIYPNLPPSKIKTLEGWIETTTHHCEFRQVDWDKVNEVFLSFLPPLDALGQPEHLSVKVKCWTAPRLETATLDLVFGEILSPRLDLSFSVFDGKTFYAFAETASQIFKGGDVVKLGKNRPSRQKALELALLSVDFVENVLKGKIGAQILPENILPQEKLSSF